VTGAHNDTGIAASDGISFGCVSPILRWIDGNQAGGCG